MTCNTIRTADLSTESIDRELILKACATVSVFLVSFIPEVISFGEPCGVAAGVAAVCVMIGGLMIVVSGTRLDAWWFACSSLSLGTDGVGGKPSIFFSVKKLNETIATPKTSVFYDHTS